MAFNEAPLLGTPGNAAELGRQAFGPPDSRGLRVALVCGKEEFILGDSAQLDVRLWNTGSETMLVGIGRDGPGLYPKLEIHAIDRDGHKFATTLSAESQMLKDIKFSKTWQLRPGETTDVYGYRIRIGSGTPREVEWIPQWYTHIEIPDVKNKGEIFLTGTFPALTASAQPSLAKMQTDSIKIGATAPEQVEVWSARGAGVWPMPDSVTLRVKRDLFHGSDVATSVVLTWPQDATGTTHAFTSFVASDAFGNREPWHVAWERESKTFWTMKPLGQPHRFGFTEPDKSTQPGINRFQLLDARWLLGTSAGVRFPIYEVIAALMSGQGKIDIEASRPEPSKPPVLSNPPVLSAVFRLPQFETNVRVINADGTPAAGVEVTPSSIAWAHAGGGYRSVVVPDVVRPSFRRTTDADGRVTFTTIERMEFHELEFQSDQYGLQRTFTNANTIGGELKKDIILFPAGKVQGRIHAATSADKEFLRGQKLLLHTVAQNTGASRPKDAPIGMEGFAEVTPDENGQFEIPTMLAGRLLLVDRLPDNSGYRVTLPETTMTKPSQTTLVEGHVVSAVTVRGIVKKRDTNEPVSNISVSLGHGGRSSGLQRQQDTYVRTDANGRFEAKVLPGRIGFWANSSLEG